MTNTPLNADDTQGRTCTRCQTWKPAANYVKDSRYKHGLVSHCNECRGVGDRRRYHSSEKKKRQKLDRNEAYRQRNKTTIQRKAYERIKMYGYTQAKARQKVRNAVAAGRFMAEPCFECGEAKVDFHHTNGYDEDNLFVGTWLCRKHHAAEHVRLREELRNAR